MEILDFLEKVKSKRVAKGISQQKIANYLNISVSSYSRFERGVTKSDIALMINICNFLEINFYDSMNDLYFHKKVNSINKKPTTTPEKINRLIDLMEKQKEINKNILIILKDLKSTI